jgi:hypothetical protein
MLSSATPSPRFDLRADPPIPRVTVTGGFGNVNHTIGQPFGIGHRYFYDEQAHTYFGYDIVIKPEPQPDTYRLTFYDLSIGPLDFNNADEDSLDPTLWKKVPVPALPAPQTVQAGNAFELDVAVDPKTGQKLIDSVTIVPMPQPLRQVIQGGRGGPAVGFNTAMRQTFYFRGSPGAAGNGPETPTVSGIAREFSADDAEMHIQQARITFNGAPQTVSGPPRLVTGSLVWFYVPNHGRYILSLSARPDLGFVKAGEVRGGNITFTLDHDEVHLESPTAIAPGDAPYVLYVLHDKDWAPTASGQSGILLLGSVSARELAALK